MLICLITNQETEAAWRIQYILTFWLQSFVYSFFFPTGGLKTSTRPCRGALVSSRHETTSASTLITSRPFSHPLFYIRGIGLPFVQSLLAACQVWYSPERTLENIARQAAQSNPHVAGNEEEEFTWRLCQWTNHSTCDH